MNSQISNISNKQTSEVLHVTSKKVFCDGGDEMGHPGVYLDMGKKDFVVCPYCSKIFTTRQETSGDFK